MLGVSPDCNLPYHNSEHYWNVLVMLTILAHAEAFTLLMGEVQILWKKKFHVDYNAQMSSGICSSGTCRFAHLLPPAPVTFVHVVYSSAKDRGSYFTWMVGAENL